MTRIVVSDTTAITHLAKIGALNLLQHLYTEILIPEAVAAELTRAKRTQPGALQVLNSVWIKTVPIKNRHVADKLNQRLDLGESEAIALSLELGADVLIIDEAAGRSVAKRLVNSIIGMIGILLLAKKRELIPAVRPYLDRLRSTGFRMGDEIYEHALATAGESLQVRNQ